MIGWLVLGCLLGAGEETAAAPETPPLVRVGSKKFTESVILGEIVAYLAEQTGAKVERRHQLGGTQVLWKALLKGAIDIYPEYTGTITEEVLAGKNIRGEQALRETLALQGVCMSKTLGFSDSYAVGMKEDAAARLGIATLTDLARHPELKLGFSNEFMNRGDGWPSLRKAYDLPQLAVRGLDHDLAYLALDNGNIDATDLYSTDAEIQFFKLRVLRDDRGHFPAYQAVLLYRDDLDQRAPEALASILRLEGRISEEAMIGMNAKVKRQEGKMSVSRVAADFLDQSFALQIQVKEDNWFQQFLQRTREHLFLVSISLGAAVMVAVPLGILGSRRPSIGQILLGIVGVVQTIPSLALLVFMIPLLGLGGPPAIAALFLYSLLPILRNTYTGLRNIPTPLRESAAALGLPPWARLLRVELPLASPTILAGIKTSAVINVGTATLGAIIGTGGYGQPIMTGIMLSDRGLILQGAIPAAGLALLVQGIFEWAERGLVPPGLRLREE